MRSWYDGRSCLLGNSRCRRSRDLERPPFLWSPPVQINVHPSSEEPSILRSSDGALLRDQGLDDLLLEEPIAAVPELLAYARTDSVVDQGEPFVGGCEGEDDSAGELEGDCGRFEDRVVQAGGDGVVRELDEVVDGEGDETVEKTRKDEIGGQGQTTVEEREREGRMLCVRSL